MDDDESTNSAPNLIRKVINLRISNFFVQGEKYLWYVKQNLLKDQKQQATAMTKHTSTFLNQI